MEEIVKIVDVCKIYSMGNQKKSDNSKIIRMQSFTRLTEFQNQ